MRHHGAVGRTGEDDADRRDPIPSGPLGALREQVAAHPGTAVGIASFLLMAVWGVLVPLFAGPYENSNYVHAAAIVPTLAALAAAAALLAWVCAVQAGRPPYPIGPQPVPRGVGEDVVMHQPEPVTDR